VKRKLLSLGYREARAMGMDVYPRVFRWRWNTGLLASAGKIQVRILQQWNVCEMVQ
jgi:hypothetical protein